MERLTSDDIEGVRCFLEATAHTCDLTTFSSVVLPAVQQLIPSVVACYAQVDPARGKLIAQETYPNAAFAPAGREAFEQHMFEHPVFQAWAASGTSSALRRSDLLSRRQWRRLGLYQEVYKPLGCDDSMLIGLPAPAGLIACICLERDGEFSERARQLLELVRPHIVQMYRNAEMFTLLGQAAQADGPCSIVLDGVGRPLFATQAAWDLLAAYNPAHTSFGAAFPRAIADWLRSQLARFGREDELPPPPLPLVLQNERGDRLTLRLLYGGKTGEQALLVLDERRAEQPTRVSPEFGLSPREAEILGLVRQGRTSAEIAQSLCISRRTVEKHLENVYCKLGVENRMAAVTVAFSPGRRR